MTVSLKEQIAEIDREIALRKNVYRSLIASGKMREETAKQHMERIEAARATLAELEQGRLL